MFFNCYLKVNKNLSLHIIDTLEVIPFGIRLVNQEFFKATKYYTKIIPLTEFHYLENNRLKCEYMIMNGCFKLARRHLDYLRSLHILHLLLNSRKNRVGGQSLVP